ncbi:probable WRKY transcription factor 53 [Nymphaea colorata]|nr:probable WRKY transcription factor 53 [Nymphaea colorata]
MENRELRRRVDEELARGEECMRRLQRSMDEQGTSRPELRDLLARDVLTSLANVRCLLKSEESWSAEPPPVAAGVTESPRSICSSPLGDFYDKNSGTVFGDQERREVRKKRKTLPKWTEQVCINGETGPEGLLDDGYSWRKYGQKDILGAKYPRAYYRCTHKYTQACEAAKLVQRSDQNPSVFDITYRGKHTCNQSVQPLPPAATFQETQHQQQQPPLDQLQFQPQLLLNFKSELKVKTEGLDAEAKPTSEASFSFPLTPENQQEQQQHSFDQLISSVSPSFVSPATTSDSNYYIFPCGMENPHLHASESDLTDIISAATSATNSPIVDLDFPLESLELSHDLSFDVGEYF